MEQTSVVPIFFHLEGVNIAELGVKERRHSRQIFVEKHKF